VVDIFTYKSGNDQLIVEFFTIKPEKINYRVIFSWEKTLSLLLAGYA
jgi:hypothetical protein